MRLFFDHNTPLHVVRAARVMYQLDPSNRGAGILEKPRGDKRIPLTVEHMLDRVDPANRGVADVDWLARLADESAADSRAETVICTYDFFRSEGERRAVNQTGFSFAFFAEQWPREDFEEQGWRLIKVLPKLVREVRRTPGIYRVTWHGDVEFKCGVGEYGGVGTLKRKRR